MVLYTLTLGSLKNCKSPCGDNQYSIFPQALVTFNIRTLVDLTEYYYTGELGLWISVDLRVEDEDACLMSIC